MHKIVSTILILIILLSFAVPISAGEQKVFATYEISFTSLIWGGKEHSLDLMKKGIQSTLEKLKLNPTKGGEIANIKVELSFELQRVWTIEDNGQFQYIYLPTTLILQVPNGQPPVITTKILTGASFKFSDEGSSMKQRMRFESHDIAQQVCQNVKGGFHEDGLWEAASGDLLGKVEQLLEATITWFRSGSINRLESLLLSGNADRASIVFILGEIKSQDAVKLLKRISIEDKSEKVRNSAKEVLKKIGTSE